MNSGFKVRKEAFAILRNVSQGEAVNCKLVFIWGETEGEPGGVTDREALVEAGSKRVEEGGVAGGGSGGRGAQEGDCAVGIDFGREGEREGTVGVPQDFSRDVGEGGSDGITIRVRAGRLPWGVEPSGSRRQRRNFGCLLQGGRRDGCMEATAWAEALPLPFGGRGVGAATWA